MGKAHNLVLIVPNPAQNFKTQLKFYPLISYLSFFRYFFNQKSRKSILIISLIVYNYQDISCYFPVVLLLLVEIETVLYSVQICCMYNESSQKIIKSGDFEYMKADFHLHSFFSGDSDTAPKQVIEAGIQAGLSALCFTDHYDADYPYDDVCFDLDTDAYFAKLSGLRDIYEGRLSVGVGVELGLQPHLDPLYHSYVERYPFDFVIGSTHLVEGADPYYPSFWEGISADDGIRKYLEITLENIRVFEDFDVYGHLDYIIRYVPVGEKHFSYECYKELVDEILRVLIGRGKGIEVNTGGYKAGLGVPNPCPDILRRYRELGGEILTIGSDAHSAEFVGSYMDEVQDVLRDCGFRYFTLFKGRKAEFVSLD